jgi:hypothetical protein
MPMGRCERAKEGGMGSASRQGRGGWGGLAEAAAAAADDDALGGAGEVGC